MSQTKCLLRRAALLLAVLTALTVFAFAHDATAANPKEFYAALEENLRAYNENFSIEYTGERSALDFPESYPLGTILRSMSAASPDGADNADYPALNIMDGQAGWLDGAYYFDLEYLATQAEIDEVSRRAKEIVASFDLSEEDDFTKIKLLYEYVCTHYTYDYTYTQYSAYDGLTTGTMVCQGYALLMYKVMWEAGIPCRIITGVSGGENHAWNIVKLNGSWYNIDATWDAADEIGGVMKWDFFLKSTEDFVGHTRFDPYLTSAYERAHPIAAKSATLPRITIAVNGSTLTNLIIRAGVEVQLEAVMPKGVMSSEIQWVSSDPDAISVTADGRMIATGLGDTVISAVVVGNRGIITAQVPTQSVDLRTSSPWAFDAVTNYYLNQLLPVSLCTDFQQGITRGELARLCYQYILHAEGWGEMLIMTHFEDVAESEDFMAILRVNSINLMVGTGATTFSPDALVTREQAATILVRLMEHLDDVSYTPSGKNLPADASAVSAWAKDAVSVVMEEGIMVGTANGNFSPRSYMTREQMIVALERVFTARTAEKAA